MDCPRCDGSGEVCDWCFEADKEYETINGEKVCKTCVITDKELNENG